MMAVELLIVPPVVGRPEFRPVLVAMARFKTASGAMMAILFLAMVVRRPARSKVLWPASLFAVMVELIRPKIATQLLRNGQMDIVIKRPVYIPAMKNVFLAVASIAVVIV
jgi:hypothetical protein